MIWAIQKEMAQRKTALGGEISLRRSERNCQNMLFDPFLPPEGLCRRMDETTFLTTRKEYRNTTGKGADISLGA